jgi:hypothetical protein
VLPSSFEARCANTKERHWRTFKKFTSLLQADFLLFNFSLRPVHIWTGKKGKLKHHKSTVLIEERERERERERTSVKRITGTVPDDCISAIDMSM